MSSYLKTLIVYTGLSGKSEKGMASPPNIIHYQWEKPFSNHQEMPIWLIS